MTAQIQDVFHFHGRCFDIAGISDGELFRPDVLELKPIGNCSACWRGYQAEFHISEGRLVLKDLHINLNRERTINNLGGDGPNINGVEPLSRKSGPLLFDNHYIGLNYHLEYTGGLLLGRVFIWQLYVHMGFAPAWKYRDVFELVFEHGVLRQEFDRSKQMAAIRERLTSDAPDARSGIHPSKRQIEEFIDRAFDRSYRREQGEGL